MQHTDKIRAEFEAWYVGEYLIPGETMLRAYDEQGNKAEHYQRNQEEVQWQAWKASREALVIQLPDAIDTYERGGSKYWADDVVEAIEAAGVTVKG